MALVDAKNLCKAVNGDITLKDISFTIEEKGIYGFLGKSGSGNSELAALLAGVFKPDSGSLSYKDRQMFLTEKKTARAKRKLGYVPQNCFFHKDMTCLEAMDFVGKAKKIDPDKKIRQIKEAFELTSLSSKINTLVGDLTLSEKKRLSISAALLGNPDVIILDEPLRYLDKIHADDIKGLIELLGKKKVVLMFGSRPAEIGELCLNVAIVAGGKLALWDSLESIKNKLGGDGLRALADALEAFSELEEKEDN